MEKKKVYHANINQKKAGVAMLILSKANFNAENITRYKKDHLIKIKIQFIRRTK